MAVRDFVERNPGWLECGGSIPTVIKAYDGHRTRVPNTDAAILRAPINFILHSRPSSFGQIRAGSPMVSRLDLDILNAPADGTLHAQVITRGFGNNLMEQIAEASMFLQAGQTGMASLTFHPPTPMNGEFTYFTREVCLSWQGDAPLRLARVPITT